MNITPVQSYKPYLQNNFNENNDRQTAFTGKFPNSKFFAPLNQGYDKTVEIIREKYFKKLLNSRFMNWFVKKTDKAKDMTTHMMVAGSTLISGMYIIRTLQNNKLDKEKRKTLALNDLLVWSVSTVGAYATDKYVSKWWEGQTRKFTALYIDKYTNPEYIKKFEAKERSRKAECLAKGIEYKAPEFNPRELARKCKAKGITAEHLNKNIQDAADKVEAVNRIIDKKNEIINLHNVSSSKAKIKLIDKLPPIKNVKDFNVEVLQFKPLTGKLKGLGTMKTVFIFGMMYRYVVPVLVMKPANKIGAHLHKKKAEKEQQAEQA